MDTGVLQQLIGGGGAPADLQDLLASHPDPVVRMLLTLQRSRAAAVEPEASASEARLLEEIADLRERCDQLQVISDLLADALGACGRCWGELESCPVCRGRGRPGARLPDPDGFNSMVVPAVRRVRRWVERFSAAERRRDAAGVDKPARDGATAPRNGSES